MNERNCMDCKWMRVQEPDFEPLCYAFDCEHSMDNVMDKRPWEKGGCDKWEGETK